MGLFPPPKRKPPAQPTDPLAPQGSGLEPDNSDDIGDLADHQMRAQPQAPQKPTVDPNAPAPTRMQGFTGTAPAPQGRGNIWDKTVGQAGIGGVGGFTGELPAGPPAGGIDWAGDLADHMTAHDAETKAMKDQLDHERAQALEQVASRSGLGGFGLSGAAGALQADTGAAQTRNEVLTLADLKRKQDDEDFQKIQRDAVLDDLENAQDFDVNKDGYVGGEKVGGNVGNHNPDDNDNPNYLVYTDENGEQVGSPGTEVVNAPVDDSQRKPAPTRTHLEGIANGTFVKGDGYMYSDARFDYYQSAKDGAFYRVAR